MPPTIVLRHFEMIFLSFAHPIFSVHVVFVLQPLWNGRAFMELPLPPSPYAARLEPFHECSAFPFGQKCL